MAKTLRRALRVHLGGAADDVTLDDGQSAELRFCTLPDTFTELVDGVESWAGGDGLTTTSGDTVTVADLNAAPGAVDALFGTPAPTSSPSASPSRSPTIRAACGNVDATAPVAAPCDCGAKADCLVGQFCNATASDGDGTYNLRYLAARDALCCVVIVTLLLAHVPW